MAGIDCIILIDECIADKGLDKRRSAFAKLAISGRHRNHSLWITTHRYIVYHVRDQIYTLIIFKVKDRASFNIIIEENGALLENDTIEK